MGEGARFSVGTSRKLELKVEKWSFPQGLSRDFSRFSLTHQNTVFYTFSDQIHPLQSQKAPKSLKKPVFFWTNFKQFHHLLPLSLFWGQVSNFIVPPYPVIIKVTLAKISFSKLMPVQSYRGKTLGGGGGGGGGITPHGIRRVKAYP